MSPIHRKHHSRHHRGRHFRRDPKRCARCGHKIEMGRYCYWCRKRLGLC